MHNEHNEAEQKKTEYTVGNFFRVSAQILNFSPGFFSLCLLFFLISFC